MTNVRGSRIFGVGVYVLLFFAALALADFVLGPLCVRFWPNIASETYTFERAYLFGTTNLALFLMFLLFARITSLSEIDGPFIAISWLASSITVGVYYFLLIKDHSPPPLYFLVATDMGEGEWLLVNVTTALVPAACWAAIFLSCQYRRLSLRSA